MTDPLRGALTGGACGVALLTWGFFAAGAGHGSYLPFAIAAAPISSTFRVGFVAAPFLWSAVGYALGRRWAGVTLVVLAMHVGGVATTLVFGSRWETAGQQWESLGAPWAFVLVWPGFAAYAFAVFAVTSAAIRRLRGDP